VSPNDSDSAQVVIIFPSYFFSSIFALRIFVRLFPVGGSMYATYVDSTVAVYFHDTIKQCDFGEERRCFCSETKHQFEGTFRVGEYDCDNTFTRQPAYLIANAVLTGCCAVVLLYNLASMVWGFVGLMAEDVAFERRNEDKLLPTAPATAV
jgi:hypothetical protein